MFPIRSDFTRLPAEALERFAGLPSALVADGNAGRGVIAGVRPLDPNSHFVGSALTVNARPGDNQIMWRAVQETQPGDVVVIRTGGHRDCALIGDIVAEYFQRAGAVALVTDGVVRDAEAIVALGFPLCCVGLHTAAPTEEGGHGIGYPIVVGGAMVRSGDLVVGDEDGAVVARAEDLDSVLEGVERKRARESAIRESLAAGEALPAAIVEALGQSPYTQVRG